MCALLLGRQARVTSCGHLREASVNDYIVRTTCRLCASPDLEKLLDLGETPLANEYPPLADGEGCIKTDRNREERMGRFRQDRFPLHLVGCRACGHVQLPVVVDPKRLFPPDYPYQ